MLALDDDVGMPGAMMISPETWREFFKERMAGMAERMAEGGGDRPFGRGGPGGFGGRGPR